MMSRPTAAVATAIRTALLAVAAGGVVLAPAAAARAQDRPPMVPTRDVDVTYRMAQPPNAPQGAPPLEQRMRWLVAEQLLRVDPPTKGLWMLVDYRSRRMSMVRESDRRVLDMEGAASPLPAAPGAAPGAVPGAMPGQGFVRRGNDQVAGVPCTEWQTTDSGGQATLACITADGVLLRARQAALLPTGSSGSGGGAQGGAVGAAAAWVTLIEAQRVQYAAQDAAAFRPPPAYQHVQAPPPPGQMPGQASGQAPRPGR